jgi:acetyl-CoA carboxylase biotin carboxyl carrier protein
MKPEDMDELKSLIEFLKENNIGEFDLEREDLKVRLKFASALPPAAPSLDMAQLAQILAAQQGRPSAPPLAAATPAAPPAAPGAATPTSAPAAPAEDANLHTVKSPIVGTFYESSSPGSPAFVKVGDQVESGQVLCIVEAMKLMNEIESDLSGEIVKRLVTNGQPVEYGQPLFTLRPR